MSVKQILITFAAAIVLILGLSFFFGAYHIVPPGHRGVVVTMGVVNPIPKQEGFTTKLPFITTIYDVEVKQKTASGTASCFSSDLQSIVVDYSVMYKTPDNQVVANFRGVSGDILDALIAPRLYESLKQVTALHRAEELVKSRDAVKTATLDNLRHAVGAQVFIVDITINNLKLSHELETAIEQKTVREQEALAKEFELQKAQKDAEIRVVGAKAEAEAVKIKGDAIRSNPGVIAYTIADKWNGVSPQVVAGGNSGQTSFIFPLSGMSKGE